MIRTKLVLTVLVVVVMVHSRCSSHAQIAWRLRMRSLLLLHLRWNATLWDACAWNAILWLRGADITWTGHLIRLRSGGLVSHVLLVHPPHPSTPQFGV